MTTKSCMRLRLRLRFLSLLLFCCVSSSSFLTIDYPVYNLVSCRPRQIQALTRFKNEFDSSNCNQTDYFNGARCDKTTGAVTKLQLPSGCLNGILKANSSLFRFHQLRYLNLSHNNFTSSSLPFEFGNLNKLEVLSLSSNGFQAQVPSSFSNLTMLSQLDLSRNELTGNFPLVRNLSNLSYLQLSYNRFYGTLDPKNSLFEMRRLRYLNLAYSNFSSSLPSEFGNLNRLEFLSLSFNSFFGQVPTTISNLTLLNQLYLHQNKLTSNFPLVQNLTNISILELSNNHFYGTIPSSLLTMPFLSYLDLKDNHLTGHFEVPNPSTSSRLELLSLGYNKFEGKILEPISKLINLSTLELSFLNTSYPIDLRIFSSLKSLLYLDLPGTNLSQDSLSLDSNIPLNLISFTISFCGLTEFPNTLKNLENLEFIDISNNVIEGKVPEWFWKLPNLRTVSIVNNSFTGFEGSVEVLVNSSVLFLDLGSNKFEGALPSLPLSINVMAAKINSFTGDIPLSICNRSSLVVLDLSYNNLTGPIPQCLRNFTILNLRMNNLEGSIPDPLYLGNSLQTLDVGYNQLTGKLPRSLQSCSSLEFISFDNNKIEDTFPFWLKDLPYLQVLILNSNKFYGPISLLDQGPLGFPELQIFEISDNNFTGSLSSSYFANWKSPSLTMDESEGLYMEHHEIYGAIVDLRNKATIDLRYKGLSMEQQGVLTSYNAIDFSGNRLEGQIPESIGLLKALIALNLSNNAFTGHIPLSLANVTKLESLDLSRNQLSGTIPNGLKTLSFLAYINVSHNQLKGEIPQGTQITGQSKSSFEGNAGLCGLPLKESCFASNASPTQQPKKEEEEEEDKGQVLSWKAVVVGFGAGLLFGFAITQVMARQG